MGHQEGDCEVKVHGSIGRDDMLATVISVFLIGVLLGAWWMYK